MEESLQQKLFAFAKQHILPLFLGVAGLTFLGYGLMSMMPSSSDTQKGITFEAAQDTMTVAKEEEKIKKITVDVEGAVQKPGVYELSADARVQDALIAAGGMSNDADRSKVAKSLNLAAKIPDGGKIYIPLEGEATMASSGFVSSGTTVLGAESSTTININEASAKELDTLPGVGEVTSQKIIAGRPYGSIDELLSKKIVGQKVFQQIKEKITVY